MDKIKEYLQSVVAKNPEGFDGVEWWDSGNYDDAYYIGRDAGVHDFAILLLQMLEEDPNQFLKP